MKIYAAVKTTMPRLVMRKQEGVGWDKLKSMLKCFS